MQSALPLRLAVPPVALAVQLQPGSPRHSACVEPRQLAAHRQPSSALHVVSSKFMLQERPAMKQGSAPPTEGGGGGGTGRPSTEMAAQSSLAAQRSGAVQPRVVAWRNASSHTAESGAAQRGSARAAPSSRTAAAAAARRRRRGIGVETHMPRA